MLTIMHPQFKACLDGICELVNQGHISDTSFKTYEKSRNRQILQIQNSFQFKCIVFNESMAIFLYLHSSALHRYILHLERR